MERNVVTRRNILLPLEKHMPKSYLTNPITEELIKEGIIVSYDHIEKRIVRNEDGQE